MNKFTIKHLEWKYSAIYHLDIYTAQTPIGVLVARVFANQEVATYWEDEFPLHKKSDTIELAKELAEFMFTERLFELFKLSKGFQEDSTIEYEEVLEVDNRRRVMIVGPGFEGKSFLKAIGSSLDHLTFAYPPLGAVDSSGELIHNISTKESKSLHSVAIGLPRYGKTEMLHKIAKDSLKEQIEPPKAIDNLSFDEPKSKYINKPQRNYRKR